jgi:flagellar biosynthesis protein FliR
MLQEISIEFIMGMALIFARFGAAFYHFPAISSSYIFVRGRIILALVICVVLYPILHDFMPKFPMKPSVFLSCIVIEVMLGILISLAAKICFTALDILGSIISMQSGLSAAMFFDPNHNSQISLVSSMLMMIGYTAIFITDTHYVFINGVVDSYSVFQIGILPDMGDLSNFISTTVNQSFILAFKLAAPFIAVSFGFLISNGILSRLMPNLQVFFVVTPVQILVIFGVLFLVINNVIEKLIESVRAASIMSSII